MVTFGAAATLVPCSFFRRPNVSMLSFTTIVKSAVNSAVKPLGLQVQTYALEKQETARLTALQNKAHWSSPVYDQGLQFNTQECLALATEVFPKYAASYSRVPPEELGNYGWNQSIDAEVLYSLLHHLRPRNIVEVGSGFSTRLMRRAIRDGSLPSKLTCIDPNPRADISQYADDYIKSEVENVPVGSITDRLSENDILFIDSSHDIVAGGDIPFLYLEVLPRLRKGVFIHIHDIYLPFDYPEEWMVDLRRCWTEQYLVQAFLMYNDVFRIKWPARYMWEFFHREVMQAYPDANTSITPSSLWLQKDGK